MPAPSYTYTLTNGSTADATQVMQNFTDILNGVSDGTKDLSISALTCAGTATLNGNVNIGNASSDDLTVTASLASTIAIKTNNSYDIGSSTLGLRKLYLGNGGAGATCDIVSASHATTREYTVPDCGAAASFVMTAVAQTIGGVKTFSDGIVLGGETLTTYDEATGSWSSGTTNTVEWVAVKIGRAVMITFDFTSVDTSTDATTSGVGDIPAAFRPSKTIDGGIGCLDSNGTAPWGRVKITSAGTVSIQGFSSTSLETGSNFVAATTSEQLTVSYTV